MRLSGAMDADHGIPVPARVEQVQLQVEQASAIALGDDPGSGSEHRGERRLKLPSEGACTAAWGVDEDEIVFASVFPCSAEEVRGRLPDHHSLDPKGLEVAPDGLHRCG